MATERRRAQVRQQRKDGFVHRIPAMQAMQAMPERVVFLDETSVKTNLTRLRGRLLRYSAPSEEYATCSLLTNA
ncbi:MAG: hypothetical protein RIG84_02135 [Roseovarius sp.]|uniref:hypothetical protein n=1 Tax=Marinovum TaxID=367771 RepID=UPI00237ABD61|nr:hypothetical protein [Marinovum sp. PR37]MDD9745293.1 hypothetical protein [Marinovum sp. PR37]